jgi:hypothetical protein
LQQNKQSNTETGTKADLFRKVAGAVRGVQDLIVEHREVESETKPDGVGRSQICKSNILQTQPNTIIGSPDLLVLSTYA